MSLILPILVCCILLACRGPLTKSSPVVYTATTLAGRGSSRNGLIDGTGTNAEFFNPVGVDVSTSGIVYVADHLHHVIRSINPFGVVSTFAGSGSAAWRDGVGSTASFNYPNGVAVSRQNIVYIADGLNNRIRAITSAGVVSTVAGSGMSSWADGTGSSASFDTPTGVALDMQGFIYVADSQNNVIRKISPSALVTTFAGSRTLGWYDGSAMSARFNQPYGVAVSSIGVVYVADYGNNRIRSITSSGMVSTLAGSSLASWADGIGSAASFNQPAGIAVSPLGTVYVGDRQNNRIRTVSSSRVVTTLVGSGTGVWADGTGSSASFFEPFGVAVDSQGTIYVADCVNNQIRKVMSSNFYAVTTIAGSTPASYADGTGTAAWFRFLNGVDVNSLGVIYVSDAANNRIRMVSSVGKTSTLAGPGNTFWADGVGTSASFNYPSDVAVSANGMIYVADTNNHRIRKVTSFGLVSTWVGSGNAMLVDGVGTSASFNKPQGIAISSSGIVYVADSSNARIRIISSSGGVRTMLSSSLIFNFVGLAINSIGTVYASVTYGNQIISVTASGTVTYFGSGMESWADGSGSQASFTQPWGLAVSSSGNVYVADAGNNRIRCISSSGVVSTLAGSVGSWADGTGSSASFYYPSGIGVNTLGVIYIADTTNNRLRAVFLDCDAGNYLGVNSTCFPCAAGTASATPSTYCPSCSAGTFSGTTGASSCSSCGTGTYSSGSGSTNCASCAAGSFSGSTGMSVCLLCSSGYYAAKTGSRECAQCLAGSYASTTGSTQCAICSAGFYVSTASATQCAACPSGSFSATPGASICTPCAPGSVSSLGATQCVVCPAGAKAVNSTQCVSCPPGTISAQGSTTCRPCAPGQYSNITGAKSCTACPPGTFSPLQQATSCVPSESGSYSSAQSKTCACTYFGANQSSVCAAGKYSLFPGASVCTDCPAGTYSSTVGSSTFRDCLACPVGRYSAVIGATSPSTCRACQPGKYSPWKNATSCAACPVGYFSSASGRAMCTACRAGSSAPTTGMTSCKTCPAGSFASINSTTSCSLCPSGFYSASNGSWTCIACDSGAYAYSAGSSACVKCSAGSVAPSAGTSSCAICPIGYSSEEAATQCFAVIPADQKSIVTTNASITPATIVYVCVGIAVFLVCLFGGMYYGYRRLSQQAAVSPFHAGELAMYQDPRARACREGDLASLRVLLVDVSDLREVVFRIPSAVSIRKAAEVGVMTLLHIAAKYSRVEIIRYLLVEKNGTSLLGICNHENETVLDVAFKASGADRADIIQLIVEADLPFDRVAPFAPVDDHESWFNFLDAGKKMTAYVQQRVATAILQSCDLKLIQKLATTKDSNGRVAVNIMPKDIKTLFDSFLYFCGRYEIAAEEATVHVSDTSIVLRAIDHRVEQVYDGHFDSLLKDQPKGASELPKITCLGFVFSLVANSQLGQNKQKAVLEAELTKTLNKFDVDSNLRISRSEFILFCKKILGESNRVVVKFMMNEDQYLKESTTRSECGLDPRFVMGILQSPDAAEFRAGVERMGLMVMGKQLSDYKYGIVMPEADRSMHGIFFSERPDLELVREYVKQITEALDHLHKRGIVHADVKLLNFLRVEGHITVTDMDAATFVNKPNEYLGAKFSSGVLPPELFYRFHADMEKQQYLDYWEGVDHKSAYWKKICPMEVTDTSGKTDTYVVRTFRESASGSDSANITPDSIVVEKFLPYQLVPASTSADFWSLGVMLFLLLTGQPWVAVNRDEDVAGPDEMARAATWTDEAVVERIHKFTSVINNSAALDLLEKLLRVNPANRPESMTDVLFHPFFDPHGAAHEPELTPFIELALEGGMSPLDDVKAVISNKWRFNKINAMLGTPRIQWSPVDIGVPDQLFSFIYSVVRGTVNKALDLRPEVKQSMLAMVAEESGRYSMVNTSIFDNLVAKVESAALDAFKLFFDTVDRAVKKSIAAKPSQATASIVDLFSIAASTKPLFQKFVARLSAVTGVQGKCAPIKNFLRVCEKVILDYESDMSRVTDLVRGKMFCDNMSDVMKVVCGLVSLDRNLDHVPLPLPREGFAPPKKEGDEGVEPIIEIRIVSGKQRLAKLGDCLFNIIIALPSGVLHVCELQVALKKVEIARDELGGHDSYNWVRSVSSYIEASEKFGDRFRYSHEEKRTLVHGDLAASLS